MVIQIPDVEFGLNAFGDVATDAERVMSDAESLRLLVDEAQLAESVGLDVFSVGEHYREGMVDSATPVILAAAAPVPSRSSRAAKPPLTEPTSMTPSNVTPRKESDHERLHQP